MSERPYTGATHASTAPTAWPPTHASQLAVGSFATYAEAEQAVDC